MAETNSSSGGASDERNSSAKKHVIANGSVPAGSGLTNGSVTSSPGSDFQTSSPPPPTTASPEVPNGKSTADIFDLGLDVKELYKHALKFYKDYELKAFTPSYEERSQLAALTLQSKHGPMMTEKAPQLGALDFVGRDRRHAWQQLGDISCEQSMRQFVRMLSGLCPLFRPFVEAHVKEQQERLRRHAIESQRQSQDLESHEREQELQRFQSQKKAVQEVLNQQTYSQFVKYAEQQYPDDPDKRVHLIHRLQEQHYQQYMQQMLQLQHLSSSPSENPVPSSPCQQQQQSPDQLPSKSPLLPASSSFQSYQSTKQIDQASDQPDPTDESAEVSSAIDSAKMWTRQDIAAFKDAIQKEGAEGMICVNHGEVVTIKVPTHEDGSCIFWEFCTDTYDIAFGVLFEWTECPGNQVSVHVSESEDEDEEDDPESVDKQLDAENVAANTGLSQQEVIIPVFRRDSHEEVFVGSHTYPGKGVYHLKFDNTYSLFRSKTLYYRVYYTR